MKRIRALGFPIGLTRKITIALVLLALALVVALASVAFVTGRASLTDAVIEELGSVATEKEASLRAWVLVKQTHIEEISRLRLISDNTTVLRKVPPSTVMYRRAYDMLLLSLDPFAGNRGQFLNFLLIDPTTSEVLLATNPREEGKYKENFAYFLEGRNAPYVQPPYYSPELMGLAMTASTPVYDENDNLLAVLAGRLPIEEMSEIVGRSGGQRQSLDAFLVNKANLFLTQPRFISDPAVLLRGVHTAHVQRCLQGQSGVVDGEDYRGERVIAVYRWLSDMDICLIVKMDYAEAVAPERRFGATILWFGLLSLVAASLLAVWLAGTITRPILALEHTAARIGQGHLDVRLPETADDELGQLTRTFNAMAAALSAERTAMRRRIEQIYNLAPSMIATANFDGYFVDLNPSWRKVLGYTEEELKAVPFVSFVHPDDREATISEASKLAGGGIAVNFENRYRKANGDYCWLSWSSIGSPDDQLIYAVALDITAQREAEDRLKASEAELRAIFASMNDVILVLDRDATYLKIAPTGTGLLLSPAAELVGKRMHHIFPAELAELFVEKIREALSIAQPVSLEYSLQYGNGHTVWFAAIISRMNEESVVWVARDVTARKNAEQALERQAEELARSNRELEQFAYVASHDLQEPLRTVTSAVQLLSRRYKGKLDSDADEFITFATDAADRMKRLINDLLIYSRAGTRGKPFAPTDVATVLEQTRHNLSVLIEESGATITSDELPTVNADEGQLLQLFQNLIGNGIKFRRAEPPVVHISAAPFTDPVGGQMGRPDFWHFQIQDNGIGIDPKYIDRIFIIFQRLHAAADYPGTGIGLALCKKIVERHGGRIWVESAPQQGSTFHFTLPAVQ